MIKVLIFDFDGTLADTFETSYKATNAALTRIGQPAISRERLMEFFSGSAADWCRQALPAPLRNDPSAIKKMTAAMAEIYNSIYLQDTRCYAGIPAALAALRKRFSLAMLSNRGDASLNRLAETLFPADTFRIVHGVRAGVPPKPDPTSARSVAAACDADPAECAIIGDSEFDVLTARNAGMTAVGAGWGYRGKEFLLAHGANAVADTPADLVRLLNDPSF